MTLPEWRPRLTWLNDDPISVCVKPVAGTTIQLNIAQLASLTKTNTGEISRDAGIASRRDTITVTALTDALLERTADAKSEAP